MQPAFYKVIIFSVLCVLVLITGIATFAQDVVTYDDVVRVSERMYCPICENEPLDECRNPTCLQWKEEIFRRLESGQSDDEIINYFVERYGQHVVGVPRDPFLRAISLAAPILGTLLALIIGWMTLRRWQKNPQLQEQVQSDTATAQVTDDYRSRIERDLQG